ncbi:MAG: hypothetical protein PVI43_02860 [Candidatus Bathyarchaeota archaeon]
MQKQKFECCHKTFKTEDAFKKHREEAHRDPLPIWCRGIMGGCVNCGGCV